MENAFVINDLMNSMLTVVEKNLSANSSNAIQQQTSLQKVNETISFNDEQPSQATKLFSSNKTDSSLKKESKFLNVSFMMQNTGKNNLIREELDVVKGCNTSLNIKQQTNLQKASENVLSNDDSVSRNASELCSVSKTESRLKNKSELIIYPSLVQNKSEGSLITENFYVAKIGDASINMVFDSIENNEVESNIPEYEQQYDIVSIGAAKECLKSIKSESNIKVSAELEKQSNFSKGDYDEMFSAKNNDAVGKIESKTITDDKLFEKNRNLIEVFSFSSLERELTPDYESNSDDSEFFLTKSPDIDSFFQKDIESCSSLKACSSNRSKILQESNELKNKSKFSKFRWFRSNRVSPDQLQSEIKTKSKAKRLAFGFTNGLRKSFNNVWKAYKSRRGLNLIVLCPVPLFFMHL